MTILLVEQYYDFAQELADHYLVMARGEFIARGQGKDMEANGVPGGLSKVAPLAFAPWAESVNSR